MAARPFSWGRSGAAGPDGHVLLPAGLGVWSRHRSGREGRPFWVTKILFTSPCISLALKTSSWACFLSI